MMRVQIAVGVIEVQLSHIRRSYYVSGRSSVCITGALRSRQWVDKNCDNRKTLKKIHRCFRAR